MTFTFLALIAINVAIALFFHMANDETWVLNHPTEWKMIQKFLGSIQVAIILLFIVLWGLSISIPSALER